LPRRGKVGKVKKKTEKGGKAETMGGCQSATLDERDSIDTSTARPNSVATPLVCVKLVVVGGQGVGKTALVERFLDQRWLPSEERSSTNGVDCHTRIFPRDGFTFRVVVWDCGGRPDLHAIIPGYYRHAHGAVVVYDLCDETSLEEAKKWMTEIRERGHAGMELVLVGTKSDSKEAMGSLQELAKLAALQFGACGSFAASAKSGANVEEAFFTLIDAIGRLRDPQVTERTALVNTHGKRISAASCCILS